VIVALPPIEGAIFIVDELGFFDEDEAATLDATNEVAATAWKGVRKTQDGLE